MPRRGMLAVLAASFALAAPAAAHAATPITTYFNDCPTYGSDRICTGQVPSFDGSQLDVDLTLPTNGNSGKHPLIVMLHGFGNDKHEWESRDDTGDGADKLRWNNHWFARHGYYVLNYTARGFRTDQASGYQPNTPAGSSVDAPNGTIHIKSREFEVRDTQWLTALVAAAYPDVDPSAIAVTGGSYGGGESWLQASQPTWDFPHQQDPSLPVLQLQVAVPKYPWTDLGYALAPSGHGADPYMSAQADPANTEADDNPIGVPKLSYIGGLYASGTANGAFEEGSSTTPSQEVAEDGPVNVTAWNGRLTGGGDPYPSGDPTVRAPRRGLTIYRSAYYQPWNPAGRKVAVFSIQGWTDDLFEPVESFRMFKFLKAKDPRWPVAVAVADVGHSRAQNKPSTWGTLNDQAYQWLQSNIGGSHDQSTTVFSEQTTCDASTAVTRYTASTPEGLSAGTLGITYAGNADFTQDSGAGDPDSLATDPIAGGTFNGIIANNGPCRASVAPTYAGRFTGTSDALNNNRTYVGLGTVKVPYILTAGAIASLTARVWDVPPGGGKPLLMTRGVYRIDTLAADSRHPDTPAGTLTLPLYGNHWNLAVGHRIRLDLAETDAPTFRQTNTPNALTITNPRLTLPTRSAGDTALAGTGG